MTTGGKERARSVAEVAGPLARPKVWMSKSGVWRTLITCRECRSGPQSRPWTTPSDGEVRGSGSAPNFALDLWANHLDSKHQQTCPWSTHEWRGVALREHNAREEAILKDLGLL